MLTGLFLHIHNFILSSWFIVLHIEFLDQSRFTILRWVHTVRIPPIHSFNIWLHHPLSPLQILGIIVLSCSHLWHSGRQKGIHSYFYFHILGYYLWYILSIHFVFLLKWIPYLSLLPVFLLTYFSLINLGNWSFVIWYKCFSSISYLILISIIKMTLFIIQKSSLVSSINFSLLHVLTHL